MRVLPVIALLAGALCIRAADPVPPSPVLSIKLPLRSYRDESYAIRADVGNPGQDVFLALDAFGTGVKVAGADCWKCCNKKRFDPSASRDDTCDVSDTADTDGTTIANCQDKLVIGSLETAQAQFKEVVDAPDGSAFLASPADGTIGLNDNLYAYGLYFPRTCAKDSSDIGAGTVNFNDFDQDQCTVTTANQIVLTLASDTANPVLGIGVDQIQYETATAITKGTATWRATFDSTSANVVIPKNAFDQLNTQAFTSAITQDATTKLWSVDCGKVPAAGKVVKVTFTGVVTTVNIDIRQLVQRITTTTNGVATTTCVPRVLPNSDPNDGSWTFGLPLFRSYCALVNTKDKKLTFAPPKTATVDCAYDVATAPTQCQKPATTSTVTPPTTNATTQAPPQQTTQGANGLIMSVLSVFAMFVLASLL